jgi:hypothetical protein
LSLLLQPLLLGTPLTLSLLFQASFLSLLLFQSLIPDALQISPPVSLSLIHKWLGPFPEVCRNWSVSSRGHRLPIPLLGILFPFVLARPAINVSVFAHVEVVTSFSGHATHLVAGSRIPTGFPQCPHLVP